MDLLSCLLGSVQCLETTLRNKSVGWGDNIPEWSGDLRRMEWIAFKSDSHSTLDKWTVPKAHKENSSQ